MDSPSNTGPLGVLRPSSPNRCHRVELRAAPLGFLRSGCIPQSPRHRLCSGIGRGPKGRVVVDCGGPHALAPPLFSSAPRVPGSQLAVQLGRHLLSPAARLESLEACWLYNSGATLHPTGPRVPGSCVGLGLRSLCRRGPSCTTRGGCQPSPTPLLPSLGWRSDDGMLPVNTAGSPGGGLRWPILSTLRVFRRSHASSSRGLKGYQPYWTRRPIRAHWAS